MIVKSAGANRIQVASQLRLLGTEKIDLIDLRAIGMFGVRIGVHFVDAGVVVHEGDARPGRDRQRFG